MNVGGGLRQLVDGVWLAGAPVRMLGMRLETTMTVLLLQNGEVLLHSPVPCSDDLLAEVSALGPVAHLYAPNTFHHLWIGEWTARLPDATLHAPAGLRKKRPDLEVDRLLGSDLPSALAETCDEIVVQGFRLEEGVLFHRSSGTLVVTDLVQNFGRPTHWWTRAYSKMAGLYDRVALSAVIRKTAFPDRAAARSSVDEILALPIERIVVGHGEPIEENAAGKLRRALQFLGPS